MHVAYKPATITATLLGEGEKMDAPDLDICRATNSVHSDLFFDIHENLVLMNTLQQITSPYLSSHKCYYIFNKLGPLFLMTLYITKHITCCINCKDIQHHISEHVYKEYLTTVNNICNFPKSHKNIFQKLHVLKFVLQLTSLSSTTFSPNYFPSCLK